MMKKIKLMAEYNYSPLWDMEEVDNIEMNELPLSAETRQRLRNWSVMYSKIINWEDPASSNFLNNTERDDFEQEGLALWQKLQQELGSEYQVFYYSEIRDKLLSPFDISTLLKY